MPQNRTLKDNSIALVTLIVSNLVNQNNNNIGGTTLQ